MSFSCSVQATKPDAIRERLDGLVPSPPIVNPAGQAAFQKAKDAFEALTADVASGDPDLNICGTISGHFYQEGFSRQNNISISVSETTTLTAEELAAALLADPPEAAGENTTNGAPVE